MELNYTSVRNIYGNSQNILKLMIKNTTYQNLWGTEKADMERNLAGVKLVSEKKEVFKFAIQTSTLRSAERGVNVHMRRRKE